jgi:hypothetical protein
LEARPWNRTLATKQAVQNPGQSAGSTAANGVARALTCSRLWCAIELLDELNNVEYRSIILELLV